MENLEWRHNKMFSDPSVTPNCKKKYSWQIKKLKHVSCLFFWGYIHPWPYSETRCKFFSCSTLHKMIVVNNSSPQSKRFKVKTLTRSLHFNYTGAPRTQEQKPIPKKIWLPIHLNNFGNHVTVRPSICTTGKSMRNVKLWHFWNLCLTW